MNHGIFKSIYFFDPNGHRIEPANVTDERWPSCMQSRQTCWRWSRTKRAPEHAAVCTLLIGDLCLLDESAR